MRFVWAILIIVYSQNVFSIYPRFFNSEYKYWNRGESIRINLSGTATADQSRNGPCSGGDEIVSKIILDKKTRRLLAKSPYIKTPPRFAKRITWLKAPTSGEGRSLGSINYCSGGTEDWIEPVSLAAGKEVTHLSCVWVNSGTLGFYLYGSQWTGLNGISGESGSYFVGTKAGVDNTNFKQEVLYRSDKMIATTAPQCFTATFKLADLSKGKVTSHNSYIIGVGFDYFDLTKGRELYLAAIDFQEGKNSPSWEPLPDNVSKKLDGHRLQLVKNAKGTTTHDNTIMLTIPFQLGFRPSTPLIYITTTSPPHQAAIMIKNSNPTFRIKNKTVQGKNISIKNINTNEHEVALELTGFDKLEPNANAIYSANSNLFQMEDW